MKKRIVAMLGVSVLWACTPPARMSPPAPAPPQVFTTDCRNLRLQLTLERKPRSVPVYELYITDLSGQPLAEDARVVLAFTSVSKQVSTTTVVAQPKGNGRYGPGSGFTLSPGTWQLEAIVRPVNGAEAICVFNFNV